MLKKEKRVDWVYRINDINIVLVEQTSQKVNKTLCKRSSTETKRKNKRQGFFSGVSGAEIRPHSQ